MPKQNASKTATRGLFGKGKLPAVLRAGSNLYTNYDSTSSEQKLFVGNPTQAEIDASTNSIGYVKAVNASALCGFTDWRLPTKEELEGIVDKNQDPTIDSVWFPNNQPWSYWTSSPVVGYSSFAWDVYFLNGSVGDGNLRDYGYAVRLVRASQ